MTAADFEAAGLYDPAAPGAPDRLALLEWLEAQGATLEQMVEAHRHGSLTGLAGDLTLRPGERLTLAEVAALASMDPPHVERLRLVLRIRQGSVKRVDPPPPRILDRRRRDFNAADPPACPSRSVEQISAAEADVKQPP